MCDYGVAQTLVDLTEMAEIGPIRRGCCLQAACVSNLYEAGSTINDNFDGATERHTNIAPIAPKLRECSWGAA
jgi:hypothetical protein